MLVTGVFFTPASWHEVAAQSATLASLDDLRWTDEQRSELDDALAQRARHGLDHLSFFSGSPRADQRLIGDVDYTRAALAYARALAQGEIDPAALHTIYTLPRPEPDLRKGLRAALSEDRLEAWLSGLAPQDDEYARLSRAYLLYRSQAVDAPALGPISSSKPIHAGDTDPRVAEIAQQLFNDDYLSAIPAEAASHIYTRPIVDAVTALQRDYGIAADGIVGPDTLGVLNMGSGDRARALAVALERRRWLSRTPPATRIEVNTAAARLRYWREGKLVDERRVIVGEPGRETPMLSSPIYRLAANPTWTVPKSIQHGELAHVGRAYLRAHNMIRRNGWIVQKPGPGNALGLVKFDMRNPYAIYLHDTSARGLFQRSQRHLSHGCVRVSDALDFADLLARDEGVSEQWRAARTSGRHRFVALPREIPVHLIYGNVFVSGDGRIIFRTDPYGWNEKVAEALGFGQARVRRAMAQAVDVGP